MGFTRFFLGFTGFYWVLLGFIGIYWVYSSLAFGADQTGGLARHVLPLAGGR